MSTSLNTPDPDVYETKADTHWRPLHEKEDLRYPDKSYQPYRPSTESTLVSKSSTGVIDDRSRPGVNGGGFILDQPRTSSPKPDNVSRALTPCKPTDGDRYRRSRRPPSELNLTLSRGPCPVVDTPRTPEGWGEDVHPEGQLLYSKVVTVQGSKVRLHTDLALRRAENHALIARAAEMLVQLAEDCRELHDFNGESSNIEACLVLREAVPDKFGYYLVNHRDQTVFWLEEIHEEEIRNMNFGAPDYSILKMELQAQYWRHVTDFPCHCSLSDDVWKKLGPSILVGAVDQQYCDVSTAPQDSETFGRLESFWREARNEWDPDYTRTSCNWICARLWYDVITTRITNYWGTDYVRLERTSTLVGDETPSEHAAPGIIRWLCILFLWNEPAVTMKLLDEAWPGRNIYPKQWQKMMETFSNEWEKIFVLSAIIFAGAMAFLAIPVQNSTGPGNNASNELITSFAFLCGILCCIFSIASLITAVNLKRDFGGKITDDANAAAAYLCSLEGGVLGYLKWGICLSLPRALFQWSVVSFCAGLVILASQLHQTKPQFFFGEVGISLLLAVGVVAVRTLSPDRFSPESILRVRRAMRLTQRTMATLRERATTLLSKSSDSGRKQTATAIPETDISMIRMPVPTRNDASTTALVSIKTVQDRGPWKVQQDVMPDDM